MPDGALGLLFEINANPEKAKEALEAFKGHVDTVASGAAASFQSLTSNIESGLLNTFGPAGVAFGATTVGGALYELAEKAAESGNKIYEAGEKTGLAAQRFPAYAPLRNKRAKISIL